MKPNRFIYLELRGGIRIYWWCHDIDRWLVHAVSGYR
jgi:hypothetical protein